MRFTTVSRKKNLEKTDHCAGNSKRKLEKVQITFIYPSLKPAEAPLGVTGATPNYCWTKAGHPTNRSPVCCGANHTKVEKNE